MSRPSVPLRRLLLATAGLSLPVAAALALLVWLAQLAPGSAILALFGTAAVLGAVARSHLSDLLAVRAYADALARTGRAEPPRLGPTAGVAGLARAVARLRRSWAQKDAAHERLFQANETILESLPDPLLLLDGGMTVRRANRAARSLFEGDPVGRDLATVIRVPPLLSAVQAVLTGEPAEDVEFRLSGAVERAMRARVEILPEKEADGIAAIVSLQDLTELKRGEQMRVDFVANASHELRTPLSSLLGFIETLRDGAADAPAERTRFLAIMHEQATRMTQLVADLLSLSRIELREHTRPTDRVDLDGLLREIADGLGPLAREGGVELRLAPAAPPAVVLGDEHELAQVFRNLIDNAIKYGRDGVVVEVRVEHGPNRPEGTMREPAAGMVSVVVSDQGAGIPAEHIQRLTERFYRVDAARSRELGGTGLGLAIVKHIVNRHRGALRIESETGVGSRFIVDLPVADG